jgi:hypothetical protein
METVGTKINGGDYPVARRIMRAAVCETGQDVFLVV